MRRRRHWTVYVVLAIPIFICLVCGWGWLQIRREDRAVKAIEEAGGAVIPRIVSSPGSGFSIGNTTLITQEVGPWEAVEISSGSHPIPAELEYFTSRKSIKRLSLNTNMVTDHSLPTIKQFRHIEILDLVGSGISSQGILQLLDRMSNLKELHITPGMFSEREITDIKAHSRASALVFSPQ